MEHVQAPTIWVCLMEGTRAVANSADSEEQSDQDFHCLHFCLHLLVLFLCGKYCLFRF